MSHFIHVHTCIIILIKIEKLLLILTMAHNVQHHNIIKKTRLRSKLVDPNLLQLSRLTTLAFQG